VFNDVAGKSSEFDMVTVCSRPFSVIQKEELPAGIMGQRQTTRLAATLSKGFYALYSHKPSFTLPNTGYSAPPQAMQQLRLMLYA